MALKDCITKMGKNLSKDQITALEEAKDNGLSDDEAVRSVLLMEHKNVIDIASRAVSQGATLAPESNAVTDAAKFQSKALQKISDRKNEINEEVGVLQDRLTDITSLEKHIQEMGIDLSDDSRVLDAMTSMMFTTQKDKRDAFGLKGDSANQMLDSFREMRSEKPEIEQKIVDLWTEKAGFDAQVDVIFSGAGEQTLYQDKERASITFQEEAGAIIRMTEAKDLSSFLHESAHLYLEMMGDLVTLPNVDQGLVDDYAKILGYLGVASREEIGTDQHELFARSFEAYMREGNAPTAELQDLFITFRGWLIRVYRQLGRLLKPGEALNDEVRGVFDRLVATDEAIKQSEGLMAYEQLFMTADDMGVSPEAFAVYKRNIQESHNEAVDKETKRMIKAQQRAQTQWWKDELEKVKDEVREQAHEMPVYQALSALQTGKLPGAEASDPVRIVKLDKTDLINRYGKDFIKRLPKPWVYSAKGEGIDADIVADMFGFGSANELVRALVSAPKMEEYIKAESNRQMQARHPDPLNSPDLINESIKAVHNTKRAPIIGAEMRALRGRMREDAKIVKATKDQAKREDKEALEANKAQMPKRENMALIKAAATKKVAGMRIVDVNPNTFLTAERKAGRLAFAASNKKDYAEAYHQKLIQIRNYEMYRAAVKAKTQASKDHRYLKTFDKKAKRQRMGKAGVLEQIEAILDGISLSQVSNKSLSESNLDRIKLEEQLRVAAEEGSLVIPPDVMAAMTHEGGINWRQLTVEEFSGIRDVIKQLEHQAKRDYEALVNGEKVVIEKAAAEVVDSILEGHKIVPVTKSKSFKKDTKESGRKVIGSILRSSSIARVLDKSGFGAVTRHIIVPIRRAYTEKVIPRQHQAERDVTEIYHKHYSKEELSKLSKPLEQLTMGEKLSKADILSIALNWGSESNREALLGGMDVDAMGNRTPAYTPQGVAQALSRMEARDWAFVQDIWDYQDSYWDEMAETERRRRGIAPDRVESLPFTIRTVDGQEVEVRGGYHPLRYERAAGDKGSGMSKDEFTALEDDIFNGSFLSTNTRAGATHNRAKNPRKKVRLSLNTVHTNLREVLRDIGLGDEVNFVRKLLYNSDVFNAANNTNNIELIDELRLWLSDAAVGELPAQSTWEKALSWTRVGFTKSKLAFNVKVAALQLTGITQSIAVIGYKNYRTGFGHFLKNPKQAYKDVFATSKFMEVRYGDLQQFDKDIADTKRFLTNYFGPVPTGMSGFMDKASHLYFKPIAEMQKIVDVTTWLGAYEAALNDPKVTSEEQAIYAADASVERAQTSGMFSDRSGLERGSLGNRTRQGQFVRLWTTLISYMLAKFGIAYEKTKNTNFKDPGQAYNYAIDMLLLFTIEGIASALLYGNMPGDDDEDQTLIGWTADVTMDSILSGIPLVREFNTAKYGSGNTPVGSLAKDVSTLWTQIEQGEFDESLVKSGVKVAGTLFHLPASQTNRAVEAAFKDFEDDAAWYEYFIGATEDE